MVLHDLGELTIEASIKLQARVYILGGLLELLCTQLYTLNYHEHFIHLSLANSYSSL